MTSTAGTQLDLHVPLRSDTVRIRVGWAGERCVATVELASFRSSGIGASAREALVAALAPLGARTTTTVMAQPAMFAATLRLIGGAAAPA